MKFAVVTLIVGVTITAAVVAVGYLAAVALRADERDVDR